MSIGYKQESSASVPTPASGSQYTFIDTADGKLKRKDETGTVFPIEPLVGTVNSAFGRAGNVVAVSGDYSADQVSIVPSGNIISSNVAGAISELDSEKLHTAHEGASGPSIHPVATITVAGFMGPSDKSKLDGIAAGATENDSNASLRDRSTHTGAQLAGTISDFAAATLSEINSQKGIPNGLGELDATSKMPVTQVPDLTAAKITDFATAADTQVAVGIAAHSAASDPHTGYVKKSGSTMTGDLALGGNKATGAGQAIASGQYVEFTQWQAALSGDNLIAGVVEPDLTDDSLSTPPGSPTFEAAYLVGPSPTGAWVGKAGHVMSWTGTSWNDQLGRAAAIGDKFVVTIEWGIGIEGGNMVGNHNKIMTMTNATPGAYAYTVTNPALNDDFTVWATPSLHYGDKYHYEGTQWVELPAPANGISQLTGEVIAGPGTGSQVATVSNAAVISKVLTGLSEAYGQVLSTDSIVQALSKVVFNSGLHAQDINQDVVIPPSFNMIRSTTKLNGTSAVYIGLNGNFKII